MKTRKTIAMLLGVGMFLGLAVVLSASPAHGGLLAAWEFNPGEVSGSNVAATGGTAGLGDALYTGVLQGNASVSGSALQLDGSGDHLQFGSNLTELRSLGSMTVAAWVKPADSSTAMRRIVEHEDNFYFWQQNGAYRMGVNDDNGGGFQWVYAGLMDDTAVFGERLTTGQSRSLFTIVDDSPFDYDASEMQELPDLFFAGSGSATTDGTTWVPAGSLLGSAGDTLDLGGGNFAVVLDAAGNGVSTVPQEVIPEPGTMLMVGLSLTGLAGYTRKRRRA